jgi:DNA-binding response OmpR family regulator
VAQPVEHDRSFAGVTVLSADVEASGSMRVLVVEDDPLTRAGLCEVLQAEGFKVETAENGTAALKAFAEGHPDLVCLDVMLPQHSGYDLCRMFRRQRPDVPLLFITAKAEEIDRVVGLELGADDYIVKPFGVREVLARIRAVLRRCRPGDAADLLPGAAESQPDDTGFSLGDLRVFPRQLRARRADHSIELSPREVELLRLFAERPGEVLTRGEIFNQCWGYHYCPNSRTLDQHISQLRKRIEIDPKQPKLIRTVHGAGYRFDPE